MALHIYNTLTRKKEEFQPLTMEEVGIYVCGPTVYDEAHLGHLRAAFTFDIIRRYLLYRKYQVKFVRNITDVDDKIITKAQDQAGGVVDLNQACQAVADFYLNAYYHDMTMMQIMPPDVEPKATAHIKDMIEMISGLIDKGYAYAVEGDVYFEVKKFKQYGKLSHQSIDELHSGARVHPGEKKNDPLDFALWKKTRPNEPSWNSPWGRGRPGWHIECSVMSTKYLGESFDIHGGGLDLIFPHHENEIAQSEAFTGKKFAGFWIHNGLLSVNGEKMSKSLGNFITLGKIIKRHNPEALKIMFLGTHYASPLNYTEEKLIEAERARERFYILFQRVERIAGNLEHRKKEFKELAELTQRFEQVMDDDFNAAEALSVLFDMVTLINKKIDAAVDPPEDLKAFIKSAKETIISLGNVLGLFLSDIKEEILPDEIKYKIKVLISQRDAARKNKDFKTSDKIRDELEELGVILEDTKQGTIWRRKKQ
ncbi:MAG: cysteine--tRNA ligase [Candidatus Omnitrophota bacterium]